MDWAYLLEKRGFSWGCVPVVPINFEWVCIFSLFFFFTSLYYITYWLLINYIYNIYINRGRRDMQKKQLEDLESGRFSNLLSSKRLIIKRLTQSSIFRITWKRNVSSKKGAFLRAISVSFFWLLCFLLG